MPTHPDARLLRNTLLSAIVGTAVEWYDFYLYATAAAAIFDRLFFPHAGHLEGVMLSYATFAIGFLVRPLGGAFFGRMGDRLGRKRVLVMTLLMMGGATTAIGLLPTAATAGIWAPILLTLLRAVQGFGSGAEYAGAVLMAIEFAPPQKRGLYGSIPYIGVAAGLLLSLGAFHWSSELPDAVFYAWGWRIPFLLSAIVVMLGLVLRSTIAETPVFEQLAETGRVERAPVRELFQTARREMFCAWGARLGDNSLAYIYESFVIVYATQTLHLAKGGITSALMIAAAVQLITVPLFGALSDHIGRRPVYLLGALLSAAFVFPFFALLRTRSQLWIVVALVIASGVAKIMMTSAQSPWFAEMFPARVRYTGFTFAREVTAPLSGGLAPIVATSLLAKGHGSPALVGWYVVALGAITAVSVLLGPETRGRAL